MNSILYIEKQLKMGTLEKKSEIFVTFETKTSLTKFLANRHGLYRIWELVYRVSIFENKVFLSCNKCLPVIMLFTKN